MLSDTVPCPLWTDWTYCLGSRQEAWCADLAITSLPLMRFMGPSRSPGAGGRVPLGPPAPRSRGQETVLGALIAVSQIMRLGCCLMGKLKLPPSVCMVTFMSWRLGRHISPGAITHIYGCGSTDLIAF